MDENDTDTHLCLVCQQKIVGLMNYVTHKQTKCVSTQAKQSSSFNNHNSPILSLPVTRSKIPDYNVKGDNFVSGATNNVQPMVDIDSSLPTTLADSQPIADIVLQTLPVNTTSTESISYNILPNLQEFSNHGPSNNNQLLSGTHSVSTNQQESDIQDGLSLDINQLNRFINEDFPTSQPITTTETSPSTDSFFQSLELQSRKSPHKSKSGGHQESRNIFSNLENLSITNFLNTLDFSSDEELVNFPSGDELDDSDDGNISHRPPRSHTGGKWKPGENPTNKYNHRPSGKNMPGGKWKPGMLAKATKDDKKKTSGKTFNKTYICQPCNLTFTSPYNYSSHCRQKSHKEKALSYSNAGTSTCVIIPNNTIVYVEPSLSDQRDTTKTELVKSPNPQISLKTDQQHKQSQIADQNDSEVEYERPPIKLTLKNTNKTKIKVRTSHVESESQSEENVTQSDEKTPHMEEKHVCTICEKEFMRKYDIIKHLMTRFHRNRVKDLNEEFKILVKYENYLVKVSPYQCGICHYYFNRHSDLITHVSTKEHAIKCKQNIGDLTCLLCQKRIEYPTALKSHLTDNKHLNEVCKAKNLKICVISDVVELKCKYCGMYQHSISRLKSHIAYRHKDGKHGAPILRSKERSRPKCPHCNHVAAYPAALSLHIKRVHCSDRPYSCKVCQKNFVTKYAYCKHMQTPLHKRKYVMVENGDKMYVTWEKPSTEDAEIEVTNLCVTERKQKQKREREMKCENCKFTTQIYEELKKHCISQHKDEVKNCMLCDALFLSVKAYRIHCSGRLHQANLSTCGQEVKIEGLTEKVVTCPKCEKKFSDEKWMNLHIQFNHNHINTEEKVMQMQDKPSKVEQLYGDHLKQIETMPSDASVSCPECGKFIAHERIVEHLRRHTDEKPFKCNLCTRDFIGRLSLRRHLMVHVGLTENTCNICNQIFKRNNAYKTHMARHYSQETYVCPECGQTFPLQKQLDHHMKRHGDRKFQCPYQSCTWSFVLKNELNTHLLTHTGEKKYLCDMCGFAAATKSRLQRHSRVHTGERNYSCDYCTYKAGNCTHLKRHMRIHIGAKPFKCPYCDYTCNTHENIRKHILKTKKHEGKFVYPCIFCTFGCNSSQTFRSHLLSEHKDRVKLDNLDKLAEYSGLYVRGDDPKQPVEGNKILLSKDRKKNPKSSKKLRLEHAVSLFSQSPSSHCKGESESSPAKETECTTVDATSVVDQYEESNVNEHWEAVDAVHPLVRLGWNQAIDIPPVAYQTEVGDDKSEEYPVPVPALQAADDQVPYNQSHDVQNLNNYFHVVINDQQVQYEH